jgi:hypothetical protein
MTQGVARPETISEVRSLVASLGRDQSIASAESTEDQLKRHVRRLISSGPGSAGYSIAATALADVGLIPKFKSYAIKAANPTGYSIFLQNPGKGFSFQLHPVPKFELFHILATRGFSRVFKMPHALWEEVFEPARIEAWIAGKEDPELDAYAVEPRPGDLFTVESVTDVHTVLGCLVEEFATNSTDLVLRLHDQNAGLQIPTNFSRSQMEEELEALPDVSPSRFWFLSDRGWANQEVQPRYTPGASHWEVQCGPLTAGWLHLEPEKSTQLSCPDGHLLFARIFAGSARIRFRERRDAPGQGVEYHAGACFVLLPGESAVIEAKGTRELQLSLHRAPVDLALGTEGEQQEV